MHRLFFRPRTTRTTPVAWLRRAALCVVLPLGLSLAQAAEPSAAPAAPAADAAALKAQRAAVKQQRDAARARITSERQAIQKQRSQQETACYKRFAVEDCLSEARTRARLADNVLRDQESEINAAERRERSADRLRAVEQKVQERNQALDAKPGVESKVRGARPATPPATPSADTPAPTAKDLVQTQALRAQQARERGQAQSQHQQAHAAEQARKKASEAERLAASRQRYEEKQREAAENRERQRARMEEAGKTKAAPLPPSSPP